jgi:hypothetical protein
MSRRVPRGGPGPEWPNGPDDGQAYGHRSAQRNGYGPNGYNGNGAPGQDQQQHHYGRPGPAGYGQQQPYGGQSGTGRAQGNMRQYEDPQRYDDQGYQGPGQGPGPGGPAFPGEPSPDAPPARKGGRLTRPPLRGAFLLGRRQRLLPVLGRAQPRSYHRRQRPARRRGKRPDPIATAVPHLIVGCNYALALPALTAALPRTTGLISSPRGGIVMAISSLASSVNGRSGTRLVPVDRTAPWGKSSSRKR